MRPFTSQPRARWDTRPALRRWFEPKERDKWATRPGMAAPSTYLGLPALDERMQRLYGSDLPRGVLMPRLSPDRPPVNHWMRPHELMRHSYAPGQIILGKFAGNFLGHLDDRPLVTIAGARAGKNSTVLEPNLYLYPGSCIVLDPKGELSARTAALRSALGHDVYVLAPSARRSRAPPSTRSPNLNLSAAPSSMMSLLSRRPSSLAMRTAARSTGTTARVCCCKGSSC